MRRIGNFIEVQTDVGARGTASAMFNIDNICSVTKCGENEFLVYVSALNVRCCGSFDEFINLLTEDEEQKICDKMDDAAHKLEDELSK